MSKKKYAYTTDATDAMTPTEATTFEYKDTGWVDQLVKVNDDTLTYDANGNVLTYGDKVFTWERGRILKSITEGENTYAYTYDEDGIRTSKTVNGVTTYFNYIGGQIVSQWNENDVYPIVFEYDTDGKPVGFYYNNTHYLYLTNQMGDVFGITNANGTPIVYYQYDEWGNLLSIETAEEGNATQLAVAEANPLRYRGYYYDTETEYYYLQSRYYDAEICRFINADEPVFLGVGESIAKWNLFSYCENEPTNNSDSMGYGPFLAIGVQFVINVGKFTVGLEALWSTKDWKFYLFGFVGGSKGFNNNFLKATEAALIEDIMYLIRSVPKFTISSFNIFKKIDMSVSFIAILGNKKASFPKDYCGWFTGLSLSFRNITVSGAYYFSKKVKIGSLGIGVTTASADLNFGQTFYFQLSGNNALKNSLSGLKSGINNKLAKLKLFACFF